MSAVDTDDSRNHGYSPILRWEDPPPPRRASPSRFDPWAVAEALRARPQAWAVVAENTAIRANASFIKDGKYEAFQPAGTFQAALRESGPGDLYTIYARYVGDHGSAASGQ